MLIALACLGFFVLGWVLCFIVTTAAIAAKMAGII